MANNVTMTGTISYADGLTTDSPPQVTIVIAVTNQLIGHSKFSALSASDTAIPLGGLSTTANAIALLVNRDPTNTVDIKTANGGTIFARLQPAGGFALLQIGSGVTAPYARANTANCEVDVYLYGP